MKIVLLDGYATNPGDVDWAGFPLLGDFVCHERTAPEDIPRVVGDAEIVLTNDAPITRETLEACPGIRYIGVLSTGYNAVDVDAARERSIPVANVPEYSTYSVAQFAIALLLELCHHVWRRDRDVRAGRWRDFGPGRPPLVELAGKTMGVVGFGSIGRAVAAMASAMGMATLAHGPRLGTEYDDGRTRYAAFDDLLARSDVVSLHMPLLPSTREIFATPTFERMKTGAFLINTARGGLVSEPDLARALDSGKLGGYAADVAAVEPILPDNPLLKARNCLVTPHIAWAPKAARERLIRIAYDNLAAFLRGEPLNVVNGVGPDG